MLSGLIYGLSLREPTAGPLVSPASPDVYAASLIPACRACKVDPAAALRDREDGTATPATGQERRSKLFVSIDYGHCYQWISIVWQRLDQQPSFEVASECA
jgi:hypothetical protein